MKAQSADYVKLQNIYKAKARKDVAEITETIRSVEKQFNRIAMEEKEIEAFCKNAAFVKLIHGQPLRIADKSFQKLEDEYLAQWVARAKYMCQKLKSDDFLFLIYIAFMAYDWTTKQQASASVDLVTARITHHRMTEEYCIEVLARIIRAAESDVDQRSMLDKLKAVVEELHRANGAELHNISALVGGMVAQEVIKVITKQYIPVDNTCVFDGVTSKTAVFKL